MEKKNLVIWIIGSNSVGKSTLAANLHLYFIQKFSETGDFDLQYFMQNVQENEAKFTICSPVSVNIGKFNHPLLTQEGKTNECCGTDNVANKQSIIESVKLAKQTCPIIIIEGIMATGQWIDFLSDDETEVCLILLETELEANLKRLRQRRAKKLGCLLSEVPDFDTKTIENISGKVRGFTSLFHRVEQKCEHKLILYSHLYNPKQILEQVVTYLQGSVFFD